MSVYKIHGVAMFTGGSVLIGKQGDTNLYRQAANVIKTDDNLTVAGTVTATKSIIASAKVDASGGTCFLMPYGTASPTMDTNGQIAIFHKAHVPYLVWYSNGTPYVMRPPAATHGTPTFTVGSVP